MENNQSYRKNAGEGAKKQKTHFIGAMSILGTALVAVIVIAVVMMAMNENNAFRESLKLGGYTAGELHADIKERVNEADNYTVTLTKTGRADNLGMGALTVDVFTDITTSVDGDKFYYKNVTRKVYKYYADLLPSETTVTKEVTVIDGVAYIRLETAAIYSDGTTPVPAVSTTKHAVSDIDQYKETFDVFGDFLWEHDGLFTEASFKELSGGKYTVSADAEDSELLAVLHEDINRFFQEHAVWVNADKGAECRDAEYTEVYDGDGRLLSVSGGYKISGISIGEVKLGASVNYGDAEIVLPQNSGDYTEAQSES